ncbi:MAG TPA: TolC family protein [candidate division Zixibacteria bacterium]|nr:TolC family protein [candidate division Zixibacteria bacterium]
MKRLLTIFVLTATAYAVTPQSLTLRDAVRIALDKNPEHKMAIADVAASSAGVEMARTSFLPRFEFSESLTKGNDQVYAFGTRLRQARFAQADFAISNLNHPEPITNFATRLGGQWNVFDSFQNRFQFRRSQSLRQAAQQQLTRADQDVIYRVVDAYYGLLLSLRQLDVAEQTLKTAQAIVDTTTARVEAGTAVDADALSAHVMYATRQQEVIRARGAIEVARTQLETALGARLAPGQRPADALAEHSFTAAELEQAEARALKQRPDLQALALQIVAQQDSVRSAKAAFGPRLDVFGSWEANNPSFASGGSWNWMTGATLRVDLFPHDKTSKLAGEKAMLSRAEAAQQAAQDAIRLDARRAWVEYDSARQMLDVARSATKQADESLRIVRDRYETGLTPVTELLRAEDAARSSQTNYWQAVYRQAVSYAALELATGELNENSVVVNQ